MLNSVWVAAGSVRSRVAGLGATCLCQRHTVNVSRVCFLGRHFSQHFGVLSFLVRCPPPLVQLLACLPGQLCACGRSSLVRPISLRSEFTTRSPPQCPEFSPVNQNSVLTAPTSRVHTNSYTNLIRRHAHSVHSHSHARTHARTHAHTHTLCTQRERQRDRERVSFRRSVILGFTIIALWRRIINCVYIKCNFQ